MNNNNNNNNNNNDNYYYPYEFFTSVLTDGFSLEFEWQQVSTSLQDSSQDSGRSKQFPSLPGLLIIL